MMMIIQRQTKRKAERPTKLKKEEESHADGEIYSVGAKDGRRDRG